MGIIDRILLKIKGVLNPQKRLNEAQTVESINENINNDFVTNLQAQTQEGLRKMRENFEGMTPEELREALLIKIGINQEFLNNPVAKEMLISELESIKIDGYEVNITDRVSLVPTEKEKINMSQETAYEDKSKKPILHFINAMKNRFEIKDDIIEVKNEDNGEKIIYSMNNSDFILSKKVQSEGKTREEIKTYNEKGIQTKLEFYEDKINAEENIIGENQRHEVIVERIDIDKAKCNKNGQIYFIDLTTANKDISTLDVAGYGISDNKIYGDTVYEELPPESSLAKVRKNIIGEMMDKSKYSKACYEYVGSEISAQTI